MHADLSGSFLGDSFLPLGVWYLVHRRGPPALVNSQSTVLGQEATQRMDQPRAHSVLQTEWLIKFSAGCGAHTGIQMGLLLVESLEEAVASTC